VSEAPFCYHPPVFSGLFSRRVLCSKLPAAHLLLLLILSAHPAAATLGARRSLWNVVNRLCGWSLDRRAPKPKTTPFSPAPPLVEELRYPRFQVEIERFQLTPGLLAEIRRPIREGVPASPETNYSGGWEHQNFVIESAHFATKHFGRRNWGTEFINGRVETALKFIPESTYISIYDLKTGQMIGNVRLMTHEYSVKNGNMIYKPVYRPVYYSSGLEGFRDYTNDPLRPKLLTAMEDYMEIELNRRPPELVAESTARPLDVFVKVIREIGNLAIDNKISPEIHDEVWAQMWTLLATELLRNSGPVPQMDELIVTYGDETSKRLYRSAGFEPDPKFGVRHKDGVDWEVLESNLRRILEFNGLLVDKGRGSIESARLQELRSKFLREGTDREYGFLQDARRVHAEFLNVDPEFEHHNSAFRSLHATLVWILNQPKEDRPQHRKTILLYRDTIRTALLSKHPFLIMEASVLLNFASGLSELQEFINGPELDVIIGASVKTEIRRNQTKDYSLPTANLDEVLPVMKLGKELTFDLLWEALEFEDVSLTKTSSGRFTLDDHAKRLGALLYNTFRDGTRIEEAEKLVQRMEPFLNTLLEVEDDEPAWDEKIVLARTTRSHLVDWFQTIYKRPPNLSTSPAWFPVQKGSHVRDYHERNHNFEEIPGPKRIGNYFFM
jgi:hypothetical protein